MPLPCTECTEELENGVRERELPEVFISKTRTREDVMREIDCIRKTELYEHKEEDCSPLCKSKGCSNLRVIDSCWKVCMCHCMFAVPMEVDGYPLLNFPNVCTLEPKAGSVFCQEYHKLLEKHNIPTKKEDFLQFLGCTVHPKSAHDIKKVEEKLLEFASLLYRSDSTGKTLGLSALNYQGTNDIVSNMKVESWDDSEKKDGECNKDTGEKARLRQRSRGHFLCVTGGGHITCFDQIFKSESPSKIFMQVVRLMYLELKDVPEDDLEEAMENYILCSDNMCQLGSLKAAKDELPLPPPYHMTWRNITKIIDRLHLANHKNPQCKELYSADNALPPGYNTMVVFSFQEDSQLDIPNTSPILHSSEHQMKK
uniref:Uncharacterized protein LOC111116419 n=1 Tax=Crassostrea virginica TaxID=6565 RepID=A0A8B8C5Y2_CRAVI|nr:uncharacterized protein LOC111116419 [Crassostrea virginica]